MNPNHTQKVCLAGRQVLIIIILLITCITSFAQNRNTIDSLKSIITRTTRDTTKMQAYIDLSSEYQNFNPDTALIYADSALKKSLNIDCKKGIADAYKQKAIVMIYLNDYKSADSLLFIAISNYKESSNQYGIMRCYAWFAFSARYYGKNFLSLDYCNKALKIAEDINSIENEALVMYSKCLTYTNMGNFDKAIENGLKALLLFEKLNKKEEIANCNISLCNLFCEINEFEKALVYINRALKLSIELKNTRGQSICLANIANIYSQQKQTNKAIQNYNKALKLDKKNNDLRGISANYNNLGNIYCILEQYDKATEYFNKSLKIKKQIEDKHGIAICYYNIARLKTKLNDYITAEEYCLKSLEIFEYNNELNNQQIALEELAIIYNNAGKYQKAYNTYINAIAIKDSVFNIEKSEKIAQLEEKYLNEKLEKQNLILKYENNIQQKNYKIYLIGLLLSLIALTLILVQYHKKNNAYKFLVQKNIDILNKEKEIKNVKEKLESYDTCFQNGVPFDKKEEILNELKQLFDKEKIFKNFDLTIIKLAKRLSTNRSYLSQIINTEFKKNYSDFINEYRIKEAMITLSDKKINTIYSIEAISKEAGFNSKASFNFAFKKYTGITPSNFKDNINGL